MLLIGWLPMAFSAHIQDHLLRGRPAHSDLGPPPSLINQKIPHMLSYWPNCSFFLNDLRLCQVEKKKSSKVACADTMFIPILGQTKRFWMKTLTLEVLETAFQPRHLDTRNHAPLPHPTPPRSTQPTPLVVLLLFSKSIFKKIVQHQHPQFKDGGHSYFFCVKNALLNPTELG